jgi:hypothetical protein
MADQTAEEAKNQHIEKMGEALGTHFAALWQETVRLHLIWGEFVELYGSKSSRIELLNHTAPRFFRTVQDLLWQETLLYIARLTDPPDSGKNKPNLTLQNLPLLVDHEATKQSVIAALKTLIADTTFCRDWRNRYIAHRDLILATDKSATSLESATKNQIDGALDSIGGILNLVQSHYANAQTHFEIGYGPGGAISVLYVLGDGYRAQAQREERLRKGVVLEEDKPQSI